MIKQALTIATVALAATFAAPQAEAGRVGVSITFQSGQASCGCPIYTQRYLRGYDCYRRPVYTYTRLAPRHGSSCRHRTVHYRSPIVPPSPFFQRGGSWISVPRISIQSRDFHQRQYLPSRGYSRGRGCR